jgi:aldose 1-epimerase
LTDDNRWTIDYTAVTDAATLVSLTQHAYFNLCGHAHGTVAEHHLRINSTDLVHLGEHKAADGTLLPVTGQAVDFTTPVRLGEPLAVFVSEPFGLDHCYALRRPGQPQAFKHAARLYAPQSAIQMDVWTDQPALHVYSANYLNGTLDGKAGTRYGRHSALCLEAQEYPNSVHHDGFPSAILEPGRAYRRRTEYRFSIVE